MQKALISLRVLYYTETPRVSSHRSPDSMLREVEMLGAQGVKEIVLISRHVILQGLNLLMGSPN